MIINIRGTNGSGKTTAVRALIDLAKKVTPIFEDKKVIALTLRLPSVKKLVWIVGPYDHTASGGCDRLRTQEQISALIKRGYKRGYHVVFEGVIVSTIWQRYADLAYDYEGQFTFVFLDTPFKRCLRHIRRRQHASGRAPRKIKVDQVRSKYRLVKRHRLQAKEEDIPYRVMSYKKPLATLLPLLKEKK